MGLTHRGGPVQLEPMRQLVEALDQSDDWTGLSDAVARRRRQNRLHQRAYRRRQALEARSVSASVSGKTQSDPQLRLAQRGFPQGELSSSVSTFQQSSGNSPTPLSARCDSFGVTSTAFGSIPAFYFPLTTDHLLTLVQYNVLRAYITNLSLLSSTALLYRDCHSTLRLQKSQVPTNGRVPPPLAPTPLQISTPHAPWIDTVPSSAMRDNLIRAATSSSFDEYELCSDIFGILFKGPKGSSIDRNVVVWGDPWDVNAWEITEGFATKWLFLLRGCSELIMATNRWRAARDEEPLNIEV